ncbi:Glycerophosphodiester phosphodiesterase, cytoplasmic [subsurface metagenome]
MIEVTGHRGARALFPENTLTGFRRALELGCHAVELDVQLTRDGKLAVIHDKLIDRTTNGTGPVASYTMEELKRFDAGQGESIPCLVEVIDLLKDSDIRIQIELKGERTEEAAPDLVKKMGMEQRVAFASFFHQRVQTAKKKLPGATTGLLITCNPINPLGLLESAGADNLHANQERIDDRLVKAVHEAGRKIIAWGKIVDIPVIDRLIDLGVDVIGSDRPDLVFERLRAKES